MTLINSPHYQSVGLEILYQNPPLIHLNTVDSSSKTKFLGSSTIWRVLTPPPPPSENKRRTFTDLFFALIGLLQNLQFLIAAAKFKILLGHHWTIKWLATSYFPLSNCEFFSVSISIYLLDIYLYDHIIRQRNRHRPSSSLSPLVSYYVFVYNVLSIDTPQSICY